MKEQTTYFPGEIRASGKTIVGVIPYHSESLDLGGFREVLLPGCFSDSLQRGDKVLSLWNHDAGQPLASTENGTLTIEDRRDGLHFTIRPTRTSYSEDVLSLVKSGTITGVSFGFNVIQDQWKEGLRQIVAANILEISPVSFPAYPDARITARSKTTTMTLQEKYDERNSIFEQMKGSEDDAEQYERLQTAFDRLSREIRTAETERELQRKRVEDLYCQPIPEDHRTRKPEHRQTRTNADRKVGEVRYFAPGTYEPMDARPDGEEMRDFRRYLQAGIHGLTDQQKARFEARALQMDSDTAGGFLIAPEQFASQIIAKLMDNVVIRPFATTLEVTSGQSLGAPALDNDPGTYSLDWIGEITTAPEDSTMDFDKRLLTPRYLARLIKVSNTLVRRNPNVEQFLKDRLAYVFAIVEEYNFLQGDGTNKPLGVFTASASGINTDRDVTSGGGAGALIADDIRDVVYNVKQQYRRNARFILGRDAVKAVMKLKTGMGDYIFRPGLVAGQPDKIAGYPFHESEYCPDYSSGNYALIFGDFSWYWIADALNMGVQVLNELYAATNQIGIILRKESDGMPVLSEAFTRLQLN